MTTCRCNGLFLSHDDAPCGLIWDSKSQNWSSAASVKHVVLFLGFTPPGDQLRISCPPVKPASRNLGAYIRVNDGIFHRAAPCGVPFGTAGFLLFRERLRRYSEIN